MTSPNRSRISALALIVALAAALLPLTASPAAAAPEDTIVISAGHTDSGCYNLQYWCEATQPVQAFITDSDNFGPTGTVTVTGGVTIAPEASTVTGAYLANIDIFFDAWVNDVGGVGTAWTQTELDILEHWVATGGVLITNEDSVSADDLISQFGVTSQGSSSPPDPIWPFTSVPASGNPISDGTGPFGSWTTAATAGTVGHFGTLSAPWTTVATDGSGNATVATRAYGSGAIVLSADEGIWRTDIEEETPTQVLTDNERLVGNIVAYAISQTNDDLFRVQAIGDQSSATGVPITAIPMQTNSGSATPAGAVTWDDAGSLPAGLDISAAGEISGTPTTAGTSTVTLTADHADAGVADATYTFSWTVGTPSNNLPTAVDTTISGTVDAPITSVDLCSLPGVDLGDEPTTVSRIDSELPAGLAQSSAPGCEISGTPTAASSANVDYTLTDDDGDQDTGTITFDIDAPPPPPPPAGTPVAVDDVAIGRVGEAFSFDVCSNDTRDPGDDVVAIDGLPAGLAYGGVDNCIISGTPRTAGQSEHNYRLTRGAETSVAQITFFIDAASPAALACAPSGGFSLAGATPGKAIADDSFGAALAAGDFDNDGNIDLAVGAPDDRDGRGSVTVFSSPCGQSDARRYTQAGAVPGKNEVNDRFGYSLAVGDFNRDNYDDLAIGVPYEDVAGKKNAGAVVVLYGSADGLSKTGGDLFTQRGAVPGANERHDKFGYALGAGDFDNDKRDDLLIGVPGETVSGEKRAGGVVMLLGSNGGLQTTGAKVWTQKGPLRGGSQTGDRLGYAIAVGDFDNDNFDDAAIGAPYEDRGSLKNIGAVHVLLGGSTGLSTNDQQFFRGNSAAHRLGWRLAAGETTGDAYDDLAAGARATSSRGMVHLFTGASEGLSLSDSIDQTTSSASSPSNGDRFGSGLAIVDHDGDGTGEVAIGVAREDFPGTTNAGAVHIVPVTATGDFDQVLERFRTQANDDVAGVLRGGSMFGAALAAGDGILFVGAPGDRAGSVDSAGTAAAVTPTTADTVHVPVGESAVGSAVPVGSYRSQVPTGSCAITTRTADDAIRSVMVATDGSGYLQVTPDDNEVSVTAGCTGVWFLTPR